MYLLLVRLMILAALVEFGLSVADVQRCHSRVCMAGIEKASRRVLNVQWRAISVFPGEAKRFR